MSGEAGTVITADQYCTFWAGGVHFGVDVVDVQEVMRHQEMSPVPGAPAAVAGLLNLRGQIVTAIDLRRRLALPERGPDEQPMNVVLHSREEIVSLLVDDIGDVIDAAGIPVNHVPTTLPDTLRAAVRGVLTLPDSVVLVLDADQAADVTAGPTRGDTR
jgi:purine-binding chemotaxis protein CheW